MNFFWDSPHNFLNLLLSKWVFYAPINVSSFARNLFFNFHFFDIVSLLDNNKQNILTLFKLNPLFHKKKLYVKKWFDLFLLYLYNWFFRVLEVLYKRNCSTKGCAQLFNNFNKFSFWLSVLWRPRKLLEARVSRKW